MPAGFLILHRFRRPIGAVAHTHSSQYGWRMVRPLLMPCSHSGGMVVVEVLVPGVIMG